MFVKVNTVIDTSWYQQVMYCELANYLLKHFSSYLRGHELSIIIGKNNIPFFCVIDNINIASIIYTEMKKFQKETEDALNRNMDALKRPMSQDKKKKEQMAREMKQMEEALRNMAARNQEL